MLYSSSPSSHAENEPVTPMTRTDIDNEYRNVNGIYCIVWFYDYSMYDFYDFI